MYYDNAWLVVSLGFMVQAADRVHSLPHFFRPSSPKLAKVKWRWRVAMDARKKSGNPVALLRSLLRVPPSLQLHRYQMLPISLTHNTRPTPLFARALRALAKQG